MNIINNNCLLLSITDVDFSEHLQEPSLLNINITVKYNCCNNVIFSETSDGLVFASENAEVDNNNIIIHYTFFSNLNPTNLQDGIYEIIITFNFSDDSFIQYSNCLFVDCSLSCKLANYMATNLGTEKATTLAMIHYSLKEAANCECECEKMCRLYRYLYEELTDNKIDYGCNC